MKFIYIYHIKISKYSDEYFLKYQAKRKFFQPLWRAISAKNISLFDIIYIRFSVFGNLFSLLGIGILSLDKLFLTFGKLSE